MRSLTMSEAAFVAGGADVKVTVGPASVEVKNASSKGIGDAAINAYEGAVKFASHVIERVAGALK